MPRKPAADTTTTLNQVAEAIAEADGADVQDDPARYRRLALAALTPLAKPTRTMIDAAHCGSLARRVLGDQQPPRLPEGG